MQYVRPADHTGARRIVMRLSTYRRKTTKIWFTPCSIWTYLLACKGQLSYWAVSAAHLVALHWKSSCTTARVHKIVIIVNRLSLHVLIMQPLRPHKRLRYHLHPVCPSFRCAPRSSKNGIRPHVVYRVQNTWIRDQRYHFRLNLKVRVVMVHLLHHRVQFKHEIRHSWRNWGRVILSSDKLESAYGAKPSPGPGGMYCDDATERTLVN